MEAAGGLGMRKGGKILKILRVYRYFQENVFFFVCGTLDFVNFW